MEARIGVVTVSDSRSTETDLSGPAIVQALQQLGYTQLQLRLVPDEVDKIRDVLTILAQECAAIFTTGGTGFGPRDVTPEATLPLLDRRADNLCELIRLRGLSSTPMSHLSRGIAGTIGSCLVVNLPGSPAGARDGIQALEPILGHLLEQMGGAGQHREQLG